MTVFLKGVEHFSIIFQPSIRQHWLLTTEQITLKEKLKKQKVSTFHWDHHY